VHDPKSSQRVGRYKGYLSVVATDFPPMVAFVEGFHYSGIV